MRCPPHTMPSAPALASSMKQAVALRPQAEKQKKCSLGGMGRRRMGQREENKIKHSLRAMGGGTRGGGRKTKQIMA